MFLVFSVTVDGDVCALTGRIKGNVVSGWDSKRMAIVQVHDETPPGMLKLQKSLRDPHVGTRIMGEFTVADQKR